MTKMLLPPFSCWAICSLKNLAYFRWMGKMDPILSSKSSLWTHPSMDFSPKKMGMMFGIMAIPCIGSRHIHQNSIWKGLIGMYFLGNPIKGFDEKHRTKVACIRDSKWWLAMCIGGRYNNCQSMSTNKLLGDEDRYKKRLDVSSIIDAHDCGNRGWTWQHLALKISPCPLEPILNRLVGGGTLIQDKTLELLINAK